MADQNPVTGFEDLPAAGEPRDYGKLTDLVLSKVASYVTADKVADVLAQAASKSLGAIVDVVVKGAKPVAGKTGELLTKLEEPVAEILGAFIAPVVSSLFDVQVGADAFAAQSASGARVDASRAIVEGFIAAIVGDASGPVQPDDEPAKRLAAAGVHAAVEGWFNAFIAEQIGEFVPWDVARLHGLTELPEDVISALGVGRLVRRAIQPLVNATAVVPMTWAANTKYRPTKLPVSTVVRQFLRGAFDEDRMRDSLARDGYRDEDIDALVNEQSKFLSAGDLYVLVNHGLWEQSDALAHLKDQGYSDEIATDVLRVEGAKLFEAQDTKIGDELVAAYAAGRITDAVLEDQLTAYNVPSAHAAMITELAQARRVLARKHLSSSEAAACAKKGIVAVADYAAALEREGYTDDAIYALELLLRSEIDAKATLATLKAKQDAERAAAAKAKAAAAAQHAQEVADAKAVKALGPIGLLEDAVIRGLIPLAQLESALSAQFPAATVAVYVADVESKRQDYLDKQAKAADAAKRAANKGLSTSELQTALVDNVLTADQVRSRLAGVGLAAADVDVLIQTMQIAASAHAQAVKLHAQAVQKASTKALSMTEADALARAGHWTRAHYNDYLTSLGFTAVDVASLDALLDDQIAKDAAAGKIRGATAAADAAKGLTLAQQRAAVIAGAETSDQFQQWLVTNHFTADAVATLMAELADAVATADAARARRGQAAPAGVDARVSLADLRRATQLGLLSADDYVAALTARGYSADDSALELDLLTAEIAAKRTKATPATTADQLVANSATPPIATATARHVTIDGELAARGLSLATTEKAVVDGLLTIDAYQAWLEANGYGQADAELLRALLEAKIAKTAGGP